ncbi:hypothetical protein TSAR_010991, partial [Trichomalopsis sarcophagae]
IVLEEVRQKKSATHTSSFPSDHDDDVTPVQDFVDALKDTSLDATNCPLSPFWRSQPELWFIQPSRIYKISLTPYKTLKEAIIQGTTESPDSTLLKLLTNLESETTSYRNHEEK